MKELEPSLFISRRESVQCDNCGTTIKKGEYLFASNEKRRGECSECARIANLQFLKAGDAAMTRRTKKHSVRTLVVQEWNQRRRRYERRGQFVTASAIEKATQECMGDKDLREARQKKEAQRRIVADNEYRELFARAIRFYFPNMPAEREVAITEHACEKYSGRVGRSAAAKEFDQNMIERAVVAHIRHCETDYDSRFGKGKRKREIRDDVRGSIQSVLKKWR